MAEYFLDLSGCVGKKLKDCVVNKNDHREIGNWKIVKFYDGQPVDLSGLSSGTEASPYFVVQNPRSREERRVFISMSEQGIGIEDVMDEPKIEYPPEEGIESLF